MSFGERLKSARNAKGLTQKQLGDLVGAAHNSISNWEKDQNRPDPDTIELICGTLGISPNYLLGTTGNEISPRDMSLIDKYKALDYHGKKAIDTLLDIEYKRCQEDPEHIKEEVKVLPFPLMPVSAGTGQYLDSTEEKDIEVPLTNLTAKADFVLRVSGDSMEPMYSSGDIILVQKDDVEVGEVGIFIVDGEGYIKRKGEDQLESINPDYNGVSGDDVRTVGKVIGKV